MSHDGLTHQILCKVHTRSRMSLKTFFFLNPNGSNILKLKMTNSFKGYLKELIIAHTVPE